MKLLLSVIIPLLASGALLVAASKGDPQSGKAIYTSACKTCHGPQGEGNPAIAKALKANIPVLGSKEVQGKSDEDLKKIIAQGTGKMKPVQGVSDKQAQDVIAFVRSLNKP